MPFLALTLLALVSGQPEKCVPWIGTSTLCVWPGGQYDVVEQCEFDTGEFLLPDPCGIQIKPVEWLISKIPYRKKVR